MVLMDKVGNDTSNFKAHVLNYAPKKNLETKGNKTLSRNYFHYNHKLINDTI